MTNKPSTKKPNTNGKPLPAVTLDDVMKRAFPPQPPVKTGKQGA